MIRFSWRRRKGIDVSGRWELRGARRGIADEQCKKRHDHPVDDAAPRREDE